MVGGGQTLRFRVQPSFQLPFQVSLDMNMQPQGVSHHGEVYPQTTSLNKSFLLDIHSDRIAVCRGSSICRREHVRRLRDATKSQDVHERDSSQRLGISRDKKKP